MGINCKIYLQIPSEGVFSPGNIVTGEINYTLKENTAFTRITIALKGKGSIRARRQGNKSNTVINKERYVDYKQIILDKHRQDVTLDRGSYNVPFKFKLPEKLPPSVDIRRTKESNYYLEYKVLYYVTIKFERSGFLVFPKIFRKEIKIISDMTPTLSRDPLTYGERKTLFHPFSSTDSVVNLKSTILDSVVKAGDNVHIEYEVANNSHVIVLGVKTKIIEIVTPKNESKYKNLNLKKDLAGTDATSRYIEKGGTQQLSVDIKVPKEALTIDNCELAARNYAVKITVVLPIQHINLHLNIPIQVMLKRDEATKIQKHASSCHWDVMNEKKYTFFN